MIKIIVTAENFAFGPVGKLLTIANALIDKGHKVTFIGYGTAYQLASKENFSEVIEMNTDSPEFQENAKDIFKNADLLISSMDRSSIILAQSLNIPVIWLDTLFWWWDSIPDFMLNVDCYIKQNTLKDNKNLEKYSSKIKNLNGVGPIIDTTVLVNKQTKNQVFVAFGGMEGEGWYKVGRDSQYPYILTDLLIKKVDFSNYEKVIITGNERIIKEFKEKYNSYKKFEFKTLSHKDFIQELANSKVTIMVPGLETPLEAFSYNVPTIFIPPSNSSQYVQLDDFISKDAASLRTHFADYYPRLYLSGRNLKEIMKEFMEQLHIFEEDISVQDKIAERISDYVNNEKLLENQIKKQNVYIDSLGDNGRVKTLEIIDNFIKKIEKEEN